VRRFLNEVLTGQSGTIYFKKKCLENRNPKAKYIAEKLILATGSNPKYGNATNMVTRL
jgi:hypothetical protein